jgi:aspartate 1-decarboxylase
MRLPFEKKVAEASLKNLRRIFTVPERANSKLSKLEAEISKNLHGFLKQYIVSGDELPKELEQDFMNYGIPEKPRFVSEHADYLMRKIVPQSVHTSSPKFIGHMTVPIPYFMLTLSKIMTALNQNLVKIETSKVFTPLERQALGMLHNLVFARDEGFYQRSIQDHSQSLGSFTSGGTIANLMGLWAARNNLFPGDRDFKGIAQAGIASAMKHYEKSGTVLLVSEMGHYSLTKSMDILGLGRDNLIAVPTDGNCRMNIRDLQRTLDHLTRENMAILAIVGIAGTTETGHVDPLKEIAGIAGEYNCHFHVDAAWGGPTLFSKKHRGKLSGIELANSVALDAHKQLYVPMGCGVCLFKSPVELENIRHHAEYVVRKGSRDIGQHTLEGSRPGMSMLVHAALNIIGQQGYELLINLGIENAELFAQLIEDAEDFQLMTRPSLNLLTYRYVPKGFFERFPAKDSKSQDFLNSLTEGVQKEQRARGQTFVSRTKILDENRLQKLTVFRAVCANPMTQKETFLEILSEQRQLGKTLFQKMLTDGEDKNAP